MTIMILRINKEEKKNRRNGSNATITIMIL